MGTKQIFSALVVTMATALALSPSACATLPSLAQGSCGNGVIDADANEDCDGFGIQAGDKTACRPPGSAGACHYDCTGENVCPAGLGCGDDGLCRAASGAFQASGDAIDVAADSLKVADVDGDGHDDLISFGGPTADLRSFDSELTLSRLTRLAIPNAALAVGQLTDDARADLAIAEETGVSVWRGQTDGSLSPAAYTQAAVRGADFRVVMATVGREQLGSETSGDVPFFVGQLEFGGNLQTALTGIVTIDAGGIAPILRVDDGSTRPAGTPIAARFVEAPNVPCDQIAAAFSGKSVVHIVPTCQPDPTSSSGGVQLNQLNAQNGGIHQTLPVVTVPGSITTGVLSADVDGDGHLDLLIGGDGIVWVSFGHGNGTFGKLPPALGAPDQTADRLDGLEALPLAVGDLTSNGVIDAVTQDGLLVGTTLELPPAKPRPTLNNVRAIDTGAALDSTKSWLDGAVGDFNGDTLPDFVVTRRGAIEFYAGVRLDAAGIPLYNVFSEPLTRVVTHLVVGDFDGDRAGDFALAQTDDASGESILSVMWGRPFSGPEPPEVLGRFGPATQLFAGPPEAPGLNVREALGLLSQVGDETQLAVFPGSATRQLRAPFRVRRQVAVGQNQRLEFASVDVEALAVGRFVGDAHADVFVFGRFPDAKGGLKPIATVIPATGDADLVEEGSVQVVEGVPQIAVASGAVLAIDLDSDAGAGAKDEVILLGAATDASGVVVCRTTDSSFDCGAPVTLGKRGPGGAKWRVASGDVTGNGRTDVVTTYFSDGFQRKVVLLKNEGNGTLGDARTEIPIPEGAVLSDVAVLNLDSDAQLEVVLATDRGIYAAKLRPDGTTFELAPEPLTGPAGRVLSGHAIAAGDFNGDGISDLAVLSARSLQIYRGLARSGKVER